MPSIAEALSEVRTRVAMAERTCGRAPGSVTLVAVSKTKPLEAIEEAYAAGQRDFGESYAQEFEQKARALAHLSGLRWHFIGHLQRNKAKAVAEHAHTLHTLDGFLLAAELQKRLLAAGRTLEVLVEVNVAREMQKSGAMPDAVPTLLASIRSFDRLVPRGLMTVPPADDDRAAERCFRELASLLETHREQFRAPALLSMGMSDDLAVAIACGATHVRVGTAIFGERIYDKPLQEHSPAASIGPMVPPREDS